MYWWIFVLAKQKKMKAIQILIFPISEMKLLLNNEIETTKTRMNLRRELKETLLIVLRNTTALPFRRYGNKYRCFFCNASYYHVTELRQHCEEEGAKTCLLPIVDKYVNESNNKTVKFDVTDLRCKLCLEEFKELEVSLDHLTDKHCKKCSKSVLEFMLEFKLTDDKLNCLICGKEFDYFGSLLLHTHRVHKYREFRCKICDETFSSNGSLYKHSQSSHAKGKPDFGCRHCFKKFHASHLRDNHEKRIHNLKKLQCTICSDILGSEYKKDTHLAIVHNVWKTKFKCTKCAKVFRFKSQLVNHDKRLHLKEKNITCEVCGLKFFDNHLLKLHLVRHRDDRPFVCDFCNKTFPRKSSLDVHIRIHTNDKRYVCRFCGKAFIQPASLKLHLKLHHKD